MIVIAIVDGHALLKLNHTLVVIQPSSTNRLMDSASLVMVSEVPHASVREYCADMAVKPMSRMNSSSFVKTGNDSLKLHAWRAGGGHQRPRQD